MITGGKLPYFSEIRKKKEPGNVKEFLYILQDITDATRHGVHVPDLPGAGHGVLRPGTQRGDHQRRSFLVYGAVRPHRDTRLHPHRPYRAETWEKIIPVFFLRHLRLLAPPHGCYFY